jgi:hypothetical protein
VLTSANTLRGWRHGPATVAARRVGDWPGGLRGSGGPAGRHARGAWVDARSGAVNRAEGLWQECGRDRAGFLGQVDLAFLATLAGHLRRCEWCWREWADGEVPVDLLTAAVRRIPAGEVFRAVLTEIRATRTRSRGA